jgi:hypothetical protein
MTNLPEVLTGDEVADLLRVSKRTVERLHPLTRVLSRPDARRRRGDA